MSEALRNPYSADTMALHKIADGKAEVLEFKIVEDSPHLGKPLSELKIRKSYSRIDNQGR